MPTAIHAAPAYAPARCPSKVGRRRARVLNLTCLFLLAGNLSAADATVIGAYPTYPAAPPLAGRSPSEQARTLASLGVTMAGGRFESSEIPEALRAAGIRTLGLVDLWQGEAWWKSHPASRPVMADGRPLFQDGWYAGVCPNHPALHEIKLKEIERMLRSGHYDVIILDFIRYPVYWEPAAPTVPDTCYCPVCLAKFQQDTGVTLPASRRSVRAKAAWIKTYHSERWYRWRADQITGFCARVSQLRNRLRPATWIGLAAVPWQPGDYDNAIYKVVGQDFPSLAKVVDVFNPMSYHVLNGRPVSWVGEVNAHLRQVTGKPVWPFVIFDKEHKLDRDEWRELFRQALSRGASGLIAFPFPQMVGTTGYDVFVELFGRK